MQRMKSPELRESLETDFCNSPRDKEVQKIMLHSKNKMRNKNRRGQSCFSNMQIRDS